MIDSDSQLMIENSCDRNINRPLVINKHVYIGRVLRPDQATTVASRTDGNSACVLSSI